MLQFLAHIIFRFNNHPCKIVFAEMENIYQSRRCDVIRIQPPVQRRDTFLQYTLVLLVRYPQYTVLTLRETVRTSGVCLSYSFHLSFSSHSYYTTYIFVLHRLYLSSSISCSFCNLSSFLCK